MASKSSVLLCRYEDGADNNNNSNDENHGSASERGKGGLWDVIDCDHCGGGRLEIKSPAMGSAGGRFG